LVLDVFEEMIGLEESFMLFKVHRWMKREGWFFNYRIDE